MLQHHKFLIIDGKQHPKIFDSMDVKITSDLTKLSILGLDFASSEDPGYSSWFLQVIFSTIVFQFCKKDPGYLRSFFLLSRTIKPFFQFCKKDIVYLRSFFAW